MNRRKLDIPRMNMKCTTNMDKSRLCKEGRRMM